MNYCPEILPLLLLEVNCVLCPQIYSKNYTKLTRGFLHPNLLNPEKLTQKAPKSVNYLENTIDAPGVELEFLP